MQTPATSAAIRQRFVEYYAAQDYRLLPRAPMIDPSIPMSFVMSAGLVQIETSLARQARRQGNKFVLVQDCFRHFDLDKVGTDGTHLSLFEMPGAFVFGPNGKAGTVQRMWALATSVLGIEPGRIWASYFKGGEVLRHSLPEDTATRLAWRAVGLPEQRLVGLGADYNYWVQGRGIEGQTAPRKCGPNTELFYDRGEDQACGAECRPGCACGRFVEFSNSLFIANELDAEALVLHPLAEPFTETVIGTERVAMVLQGAPSVFDIDGRRPFIDAIHGFVRNAALPEAMRVFSERVIADYLRALCCLVADGAPPPGKNGRARIIKLLIRGVLTHQIILGIDAPGFLARLAAQIVPSAEGRGEGPAAGAQLEAYFKAEAGRFSKTVERGCRHFALLLDESGGRPLSGHQVAGLEKTWGLPHRLTAALLWQRGLPFPEAEYRESLKRWKQTLAD